MMLPMSKVFMANQSASAGSVSRETTSIGVRYLCAKFAAERQLNDTSRAAAGQVPKPCSRRYAGSSPDHALQHPGFALTSPRSGGLSSRSEA